MAGGCGADGVLIPLSRPKRNADPELRPPLLGMMTAFGGLGGRLCFF
jgi:hypothetical protein